MHLSFERFVGGGYHCYRLVEICVEILSFGLNLLQAILLEDAHELVVDELYACAQLCCILALLHCGDGTLKVVEHGQYRFYRTLAAVLYKLGFLLHGAFAVVVELCCLTEVFIFEGGDFLGRLGEFQLELALFVKSLFADNVLVVCALLLGSVFDVVGNLLVVFLIFFVFAHSVLIYYYIGISNK